jgi:hypothetical protein
VADEEGVGDAAEERAVDEPEEGRAAAAEPAAAFDRAV